MNERDLWEDRKGDVEELVFLKQRQGSKYIQECEGSLSEKLFL